MGRQKINDGFKSTSQRRYYKCKELGLCPACGKEKEPNNKLVKCYSCSERYRLARPNYTDERRKLQIRVKHLKRIIILQKQIIERLKGNG